MNKNMSKRIAPIALAVCFMLCVSAGCRQRQSDAQAGNTPLASQAVTASPTALPTEKPTAEPTPSPELVPTLAPYIDEALSRAVEHGLTPLDVRGEYELFVRFADTVDGNAGMDGFRDFVYKIFPVIADHMDHMDADSFFARLGELDIRMERLGSGNGGEYFDWNTSIVLNETELRDLPCRAPSALFHELMHFLDFTLGSGNTFAYLLDGRAVPADKIASFTDEQWQRAVACREANVILEGGAEYVAAQYLNAAPGAYMKNCEFLAGLDYIFGEGTVEELFFRRDSDGAFAQMLLDAGYSNERYFDACDSLNYFSRSEVFSEPERFIAPEDILIDLYEAKRGSGWQQDKQFLYILKVLNGVALEEYKASEHADFLKDIVFCTWAQYEEFQTKLLGELPFEADLMILPPFPAIRGGRMLLAAYARWVDPDTHAEKRGAIFFDMDIENEILRGYSLNDLDALSSEYFDLG